MAMFALAFVGGVVGGFIGGTRGALGGAVGLPTILAVADWLLPW